MRECGNAGVGECAALDQDLTEAYSLIPALDHSLLSGSKPLPHSHIPAFPAPIPSVRHSHIPTCHYPLSQIRTQDRALSRTHSRIPSFRDPPFGSAVAGVC